MGQTGGLVRRPPLRCRLRDWAWRERQPDGSYRFALPAPAQGLGPVRPVQLQGTLHERGEHCWETWLIQGGSWSYTLVQPDPDYEAWFKAQPARDLPVLWRSP